MEDNIIEYDMDSYDQSWLSKQPKWRLAPEKFERCMEWLENECELQVPSHDSLLLQPFVRELEFDVVEGIYDHWLDKRLTGKQKLLHRVKQESKRKRPSKLLKLEDPYVAFRQCQEKMHTRKNRAVEHENYVKMLRGRQEIYQWWRYIVKQRNDQLKKLQIAKAKLAMFEEQFRTRNFFESHLKLMERELEGVFENDSDELIDEMYADSSFERDEDNRFEFVPRAGCFYHAVGRIMLGFLV